MRLSNTSWRAWAGLVAAPAAWAAHHQAGSDLNFADCTRGDGATLALIGVAALAVALAGGVFSYGAWRAAGGGVDRKDELTGRFIPVLGQMASALFGLTILVQIGAALTLPACFR